MTSGPSIPALAAIDEVRRLCAPYVGMLVANGDAPLANVLQSRLKDVSQGLCQDNDSDPALRRQLGAANLRADELSRQVRELSLRLLAANGELKREVARADRAEAALRPQMPQPRDDAASAAAESRRG